MRRSSGSSTEPTRPTTRFGRRSVLSAVALVLVAVPGALTLLLVEGKWAPLLEADNGARDRLHSFAVSHQGFVEAMQLISDSGSALAWQIVLGVVVVWLLWRRLPRLALFVAITAAGSSVLNTVVKTAVHRLRLVLTDPVAHEPGSSFPCCHAQAAIVGYAVLLLVVLPVLHGAWRSVASPWRRSWSWRSDSPASRWACTTSPTWWAALSWLPHGWLPWRRRSMRCGSTAETAGWM